MQAQVLHILHEALQGNYSTSKTRPGLVVLFMKHHGLDGMHFIAIVDPLDSGMPRAILLSSVKMGQIWDLLCGEYATMQKTSSRTWFKVDDRHQEVKCLAAVGQRRHGLSTARTRTSTEGRRQGRCPFMLVLDQSAASIYSKPNAALVKWLSAGGCTLQASRMGRYPVQRHKLPSSAFSICSALGVLPLSSCLLSAAWHATTMPGVQNPHWLPWCLAMASAVNSTTFRGAWTLHLCPPCALMSGRACNLAAIQDTDSPCWCSAIALSCTSACTSVAMELRGMLLHNCYT